VRTIVSTHDKAKALFSCEKISDFDTVVFSFLFDKYYPIIY
jgi:hypothetical protein